jgi:N-acetyl-anhydromuramyl-L-alanine amidase AmpD
MWHCAHGASCAHITILVNLTASSISPLPQIVVKRIAGHDAMAPESFRCATLNPTVIITKRVQ